MDGANGALEDATAEVVVPVEEVVDTAQRAATDEIGGLREHLTVATEEHRKSREAIERLAGHLAEVSNQLVAATTGLADAASKIAGNAAESVLEVPPVAAETVDTAAETATEPPKPKHKRFRPRRG